MRDTVQIAFFVLSALALVCIVQLLLLILAHSDSCPKAAKVVLPHLLLIPAAAFLFLIPAAILCIRHLRKLYPDQTEEAALRPVRAEGP